MSEIFEQRGRGDLFLALKYHSMILDSERNGATSASVVALQEMFAPFQVCLGSTSPFGSSKKNAKCVSFDRF